MNLHSANPDRTIYLKQCPRCKGDLSASRDQYGDYLHCLQCGYMADVRRPNPFAMLRARFRHDDVA